MKIIKIAFLAAFLSGLAACASGVNVSTDYDEASDFAPLRSFNWYSTSDGSGMGSIMDGRIRSSIDNQLAAQGYEKRQTNPGFLINYSVTTEDKIDIRTYNNYGRYPGRGYGPGWGWDAGYGYRGMPMSMYMQSETVVREYTKGTLIIDILDGNTKQLIWRGMGSKKIPSITNPQVLNNLVNEVVASILLNFPPKYSG